MKVDGLIKRDVEDELSCDPRLTDSEIAVAVSDGTIALSGMVRSYAQRQAALRLAEWVAGSGTVVDRLRVQLAEATDLSDDDIAQRAANAMRWEVDVPSSLVRVRVVDGELTLDGAVGWEFERAAAGRAVRHLVGVHKVANRIVVAPHRLGA